MIMLNIFGREIKKVGVLAFCIVSLSSCLDLDPVVNDKISPENFFKSESDAKAAVTAIYNPFVADWGGVYCASVGSYLNLSNLCTDEMSLQRNDLEIVDRFLWTATTGDVTGWYTNWVQQVSRTTILLANLENTPMSEEKKAQFMAEVKCARGQFLFYLYDFYGTAAVCLDPEILNNPEVDVILERYPKDEFIALIEKDLKEAAEVLPATYESADWGRFSKGAAYAILVKLYMQEKRWKEAETVCRQIQELGCYGLQANYNDVFSVATEVNNEVIWAVPCLSEGGSGNMWLTHIVPPNYPLKNDKIQRWYVYNTPWDFYDRLFVNKQDKRLDLLIGEFKYIPEGQTDSILATRENYEHLKKGALPFKYPEDPNQTGEYSGNDMVIYRYADVLLELAEAINEQAGPTKEAISFVESIRARAGVPNTIPASATASKDAFRDFILDERGRELFCEGHRRRDLIRHGKFISTAHEQGWTSAQSYMELFPIPQNVIDESKGKIKQNPGY